jgi:septal ring factor EnvC (AmiA/AmiB activator)
MQNKFTLKTGMLLIALLSGFFVSAQTTLTKSEKKALKKELKTFKKDLNTYSENKAKQEATIQSLNHTVDSLNEALAAMAFSKDSLISALTDAGNEIQKLTDAQVECGKVPSSGVVYAVQVGNYKKLDLKAFFNGNKAMRTENFTGGNAYMVGNFTTVEEALEFARNMKKLGILDAFVTKYDNGERVIDFDATSGNR